MARMSIKFILMALRISKFSRWCTALCDPHPGHSTPRYTSVGQRGKIGVELGEIFIYMYMMKHSAPRAAIAREIFTPSFLMCIVSKKKRL